jgi:hypothetical protein
MRWWYFQRVGEKLKLAPLDFFTYRPSDATPSDNPMTPWYDLYNHIDEVHVHVQAETYEIALALAYLMVKEKEASIEV